MNELKSLNAIFDGKLFRIPDYQRGYAWQQKQLTDFWNDLLNLPNDGRAHYTGVLTLKRISGLQEAQAILGGDSWLVKRDNMPCYVVDGQQRLTTAVILISQLLQFITALPENAGEKDGEIVLDNDSAAKIKAKYICEVKPGNQITTYFFGYENSKNNPSADYLKYKIFGAPSGGSVAENYYTRNLQYAKDFFLTNMKALYENARAGGLAALNELYVKLTQRFMFVIHEINEEYDECVAFETMNNRGKQLTNLELLKNRLIYLTTLFQTEASGYDEHDQKALREAINDAWSEIYLQLGKNKALLSDDEFLRAHWIFYYKYSRKRGSDYISYLLEKFSPQSIYEQTSVLPDEKAAETVAEFNPEEDEDEKADIDPKENTGKEPRLAPQDIRSYVDSLKNAIPYWYLTYYPNDGASLNNDEKIWLDRLNRIGIGYFRPLVTVIYIKAGLFPLEKKLQALKAVERFIFILFRIGRYRSNYKSSFYYRMAKELYHSEKGIDELTGALNLDIDNNIDFCIKNFIADIQQKFKEGNGFYDWNSKYYFFYEYEYYLQKCTGVTKITNWESFVKPEDKISIEHILPQTPTEYYWRNAFRQYNEQEIKWLSSALGNLLPLAQSVNASLQNKSFDEKKNPRQEERRGYADGSHSEIQVARYEEWTGRAIYERSQELLRFLSTRWNCKLSEEQIKELAFVSFVEDERQVPSVLS